MTYPVFAASDILYASDMNAVGLWKINDATATFTGGTAGSVTDGTVTIGTNNTAVTVNNAFSSTYANYLITLSGGASSTGSSLRLQLGATTTGYYAGYVQVTLATAALTGAADNNGAQFTLVGVGDPDGLALSVTVLSPQLAKHTWIHGMAQVGNAVTRTFSGKQASTTQFTSFTISPSTGDLTGGQIRVYGYRN